MKEIITDPNSSMSISYGDLYGELIFKQGNHTIIIKQKDIPEIIKSMMDGIKI